MYLLLALFTFWWAQRCSAKPCVCNITEYVPASTTTTQTSTYIAYTGLTLYNYTATQTTSTATKRIGTTSTLSATSPVHTLTNSVTITVHVPLVTTTVICTSATIPFNYISRASYCTCPRSTTLTSTITPYFYLYSASTYYTATTTLTGTSTYTTTISVKSRQDILYFDGAYSYTTTTYTKSAYKATKTKTMGPFRTPSAFKLQLTNKGPYHAPLPYDTGYLYENEFIFDYYYYDYYTPTYTPPDDIDKDLKIAPRLPDPALRSCTSTNATNGEASIYHFVNGTTLVAGDGLCTSMIDCPFSIGLDVTQCFIDCAGFLRCQYLYEPGFGANGAVYSTFLVEPTYNRHRCISEYLPGDPVHDVGYEVEVSVVSV